MTIKKLSNAALTEWVSAMIVGDKTVYGIQAHSDKSDRFTFAALNDAAALRLDYDVAVQPPRKFFQPPVDTLLEFETSGNYTSVYDTEQFILLGVHPYDMIALNQMDILFSQDNYDSHYMTRRNNAVIIACDVVTPSKDVFASSMGTATVDSGWDILITVISDGYVVEAATDKGKTLLDLAKGTKASGADLNARKAVWEENTRRLNQHPLDCDVSEIPALLDDAYKHPVWEEKARTCFACGSCNQVCPTCYCFNIHDNVNWDLSSGDRQATWDGCLLDGFTKVAPNHEFRADKANRFRHRLFRKGKYVPSKIGGQVACVGCGRCIAACLPDIANPVAVYNRLHADKAKA